MSHWHEISNFPFLGGYISQNQNVTLTWDCHIGSCLNLPSWSSEVEHNPKMSISFFLAGEGWWMGFESIDQPSWSSEVECNPKMSISFFWLERGGGWGLSPSTSPADHQKLNVIQKWAFHFFGWRTPSATPLQPKKWNARFWITFNFWWLAGMVNGLEPHLPPLSSQKNEMLIFGLHSTSDDQLGWSMDSNPIHHPSPAKKNEMLIFGLHSTSDDQLGWSMDSNPIHHPSPAKKNEMLIFGLCSTSDDQLGKFKQLPMWQSQVNVTFWFWLM